MYSKTTTGGFLQIILIIVIAVIALGYFGIKLTDILASPIVRENLEFLWNTAREIWNSFLSEPAHWIWEHIIRFLWELLLRGLGIETTPA